MAVRLINPIKSTPISAYVPLPTELMAQNLQQDQERFDFAEAGIRAFDDVFKSGYSSKHLEEALKEEYDPKIKEFADTLYSTGNAGYITSAIAELNKKLLADQRYRTALEDYNYREILDKRLAEKPEDFYTSSIRENGRIVGWNDIQAGQNVGAHYGSIGKASAADDVVNYGVKLLTPMIRSLDPNFFVAPDGSLIMSEEARKQLNWNNPYIKQAADSLTQAMISNPEQYAGINYLKHINPENWEQAVDQLVKAQFEQRFFDEHNKTNRPISSGSKGPTGVDGVNPPDSSVLAIEVATIRETPGLTQFRETKNDAEQNLKQAKEKTINNILSTLNTVITSEDDLDLAFGYDFSKEFNSQLTTFLGEEKANQYSDLYKKLVAEGGQGRSLAPIYKSYNIDKEDRKLIEEAMLSTLNTLFTNPVYVESQATLFQRFQETAQTNNVFEEASNNYLDFYLNDNNFGQLFRGADGNVNSQAVEKFERALEKAKGDINKIKLNDFLTTAEIIRINEPTTENGVPVVLMNLLRQKGITTLKRRGASGFRNLEDLSIDDLLLDAYFKKAPLEMIHGGDNEKAHEIILDYYKNKERDAVNKFELRKAELGLQPGEVEIHEPGVTVVQGGNPTKAVKDLMANVYVDIDQNFSKVFYDPQKPTEKLNFEGKNVEFTRDNSLILTPSSIAEGRARVTVSVTDPENKTTTKKLVEVPIHNPTLIENVLNEAIATAKINGDNQSLDNLYTLYGIHTARQLGQYKNLGTALNVATESSPKSVRATFRSINLGNLEFKIKATGDKNNRTYRVEVGGVVTGLSQQEVNKLGSGLQDENEIWQFIGKILDIQRTAKLKQADTPGGGRIPLARGESFKPQ